jgi:hypothetical protein
MESCGPGTEILVPMLTFVHDGRGTSINVLLHPYLRDALSSIFTASKHNLFYFTGDLASFLTTSVIASFSLLHTCSHSPRDYAQVPTIDLFSLVISNSLVALDSVCEIVSKISPFFIRANEVLLGRFFFLTLDGFLIICLCQNSQFQ